MLCWWPFISSPPPIPAPSGPSHHGLAGYPFLHLHLLLLCLLVDLVNGRGHIGGHQLARNPCILCTPGGSKEHMTMGSLCKVQCLVVEWQSESVFQGLDTYVSVGCCNSLTCLRSTKSCNINRTRESIFLASMTWLTLLKYFSIRFYRRNNYLTVAYCSMHLSLQSYLSLVVVHFLPNGGHQFGKALQRFSIWRWPQQSHNTLMHDGFRKQLWKWQWEGEMHGGRRRMNPCHSRWRSQNAEVMDHESITPHSCSPYLELKQFSNESNVPKRPMTGPEFCFFKYLLSLLPPLLLQQKSKGWCSAFQHFPHTITTVDNSMMLTFCFYETTVEWNNRVRSTDCIKQKKTMQLGIVQRFQQWLACEEKDSTKIRHHTVGVAND